jgi:hypothetical protein
MLQLENGKASLAKEIPELNDEVEEKEPEELLPLFLPFLSMPVIYQLTHPTVALRPLARR